MKYILLTVTILLHTEFQICHCNLIKDFPITARDTNNILL